MPKQDLIDGTNARGKCIHLQTAVSLSSLNHRASEHWWQDGARALSPAWWVRPSAGSKI